jgi:hypothetical protein
LFFPAGLRALIPISEEKMMTSLTRNQLIQIAVQKLLAENAQMKIENESSMVEDSVESMTNIVKKYVQEFPEIDDPDVIVRNCTALIQVDVGAMNQQNLKNNVKPRKELCTMIVKSTLGQKELLEIYELLKVTFSDLSFFQDLIAEKLWLFLQDSNNMSITEQFTKKCVDKYYDVPTFEDPTKPERKIVLNQIRLVFKCCLVLILGFHPFLREYRCEIAFLL